MTKKYIPPAEAPSVDQRGAERQAAIEWAVMRPDEEPVEQVVDTLELYRDLLHDHRLITQNVALLTNLNHDYRGTLSMIATALERMGQTVNRMRGH